MTLRPIAGAPMGATVPSFPGSVPQYDEPSTHAAATPAVYWENRYIGLWIAPNPIPGDTMDCLLQINWRYPSFKGRGSSFALLIDRADLTDALTKAKRFIADWTPGILATSRQGLFVALGDPDYHYYIKISTTGGVNHAESREDSLGVRLTLRRDSIPDVPPEPKRKADASISREFTLTRSELDRLCAKLES